MKQTIFLLSRSAILSKPIFALFSILLLNTTAIYAQLNIVCMGNSITQGKASRELYHGTVIGDSLAEMSYRFFLWEKLDSAGYEVDFVGYNKTYFEQQPNDHISSISRYTGHLFPNAHEAYYGITSGGFYKGEWKGTEETFPPFKDRITTYPVPDIALIHLGTNDAKMKVSYTKKNLKKIITELRMRNPNITIFLASLITDWVHISQETKHLAHKLNTKESPVIWVNMKPDDQFINDKDNPNSFTFDWVHPNARGQKYMAQRWFESITQRVN